jgi:starch-binding outer membrane protein, SusD/RagB family
MRKIYRTLLCGSLLLFSLGFSSCEDYLDKEADSTVSEEEAFKNFRNFQGFIEEIYNCIPDKEKNNYTTSWNWGDDEIFNPEGDSHMTHQVDLGNFRAWSTNNQCWLYRTGSDPTATYHP